MAQQKLYTEDEIRRTFGSGFTEARFRRFMNELTPIELPSDEEIYEKAYEVGYTTNLFSQGAKWMRDKIQGGNK